RREEGNGDRARSLGRRPAPVQARRAARDDELRLHRQAHQAVEAAGGLPAERRRGHRAEERTDRRPRRRPADGVLRHRGAGAELEDPRPVREHHRRALRDGPREGQPAHGLREQSPLVAAQERPAEAHPADVAGEGSGGAGPPLEPAAVARRSRILDFGGARGGVGIAVLSTVVVFVGLVILITHAPGWPEVKNTFFNWDEYKSSSPEIARAFKLNVKIFLIAEALILPFALFIAVLRSLPGPVFFPLRLIAIAYTDLFRGVPTILVIAVLGFGAPTLQLSAVP